MKLTFDVVQETEAGNLKKRGKVIIKGEILSKFEDTRLINYRITCSNHRNLHYHLSYTEPPMLYLLYLSMILIYYNKYSS